MAQRKHVAVYRQEVFISNRSPKREKLAGSELVLILFKAMFQAANRLRVTLYSWLWIIKKLRKYFSGLLTWFLVKNIRNLLTNKGFAYSVMEISFWYVNGRKCL